MFNPKTIIMESNSLKTLTEYLEYKKTRPCTAIFKVGGKEVKACAIDWPEWDLELKPGDLYIVTYPDKHSSMIRLSKYDKQNGTINGIEVLSIFEIVKPLNEQ